MSEGREVKIDSFEAAISILQYEKGCLEDSRENTEWLRYVFRRIPLFSSAGLVFYLTCFSMTFVRDIGFTGVNKFLKAPIVIPCNGASIAFLVALILLCFLMVWNLYLMKVKRNDGKGKLSFKEEVRRNGVKGKSNQMQKYITTCLLLMLLISGVALIRQSEFPLVLGLTTFSVVTFFSMITDRTLGFTRGNERSRLFATRAESLQIMLRSRLALNEKFEKSHLDELYKFFDELRLMKYNDTVADTQYLMTQLEKLKEKK
ncbi:hypothetical protein [Undibacterium squillarum]|uniref:hypothetical protein n=1 Tax=Undibacterium squillarum TaxID=1131567 RepID=UPI0035B4E3ED